MGALSDLISIVSRMFLGGASNSKAFTEALMMSERYLGWGQERKDMRDFLSALSYCEKCSDQDAPKDEFLERKYSCLNDTLVGAAEQVLEDFEDKTASVQEELAEATAEKTNLAAQIKTGHERIAKLTSDGSLIKAKDERVRLDDVELRRSYLENRVHSGEFAAKNMANYEAAAGQMEEFCRRAELMLANLQTVSGISPELIAKIKSKVMTQVETVRSRVKCLAVNAEVTAPAPDPAAADQPASNE